MDFDLLDDVLWVADSLDSGELAEVLFRQEPTRLGPVVEYSYIKEATPILPELRPIVETPAIMALARAQSFGQFEAALVNSSPHALAAEVCWIPPSIEAFADNRWSAFRKRLQDAAERAGWPKRLAQGFTGAVDELVSNVFEHSQRPRTGMVGYRWYSGEFEYVVADAGEGVLGSLKRHSDYAELTDAGSALHTALSPGESRFGRESQRGQGFRQLFLSLADIGARLRFRSSDARLEISGEAASLTNARIASSVRFDGLLVSVVCNR